MASVGSPTMNPVKLKMGYGDVLESCPSVHLVLRIDIGSYTRTDDKGYTD